MTSVYLTDSIFIKPSNPLFRLLDEYAFKCKNLYNTVTYLCRHVLFEHNTTPSAFQMIGNFTASNYPDYKAIPAKVAQQTVMQVHQNFQSFWQSIKAYRKDKTAFTGRPKPPKYLDSIKGRANIILTKQAVSKRSLANGVLSLSTYDQPIDIPLGRLADKITFDSLQEVKIVRKSKGYAVKLTYKTTSKDRLPISNRLLGIDLGVNNFATVTSNVESIMPLIVSGKVVKSINQHFNKARAKLQLQKDSLPKGSKTKPISKFYEDKHKFYHKRLVSLSQHREHQINDYLHKASRYLINYAVSNAIDTIVIGKNVGWKQGIAIGKVNNQTFVNIPFARFIELVTYKAQLKGIVVITSEESYTSKCSFLDSEPVQKQATYLGKRLKRGLFKSANGTVINADVNGSLNILRKVIGNFTFDPIRVCSTPKVVNVLKQNTGFH